MREGKEIKVLIVDDHEIVRQGFKLLLNTQTELNLKVTELTDGKGVLAAHKKEKFDIVFMDINMKDIGGVEATKSLLNKYKKVKVIALSMHNDDFNIKRMLDAGAAGYLLKDTSIEEINKAIISVLNGKKYFSNEVALKLIGIAEQNSKKSKITKRELEVLNYIANGFTNDEIASKLELSKRTIDSHRQNLLTKFECKNTVGLISYALKSELISL